MTPRLDRSKDPGMQDYSVAGGSAAGDNPFATNVREAVEEANIDEPAAQRPTLTLMLWHFPTKNVFSVRPPDAERCVVDAKERRDGVGRCSQTDPERTHRW